MPEVSDSSSADASRPVLDGRDRHGRWFEDFTVGSTILHWPGHTVTQAENQAYTQLTGNLSAAHLDAEFARSEGHPAPLVNGGLILGIVHGLSVLDVSSSPKAVAQLGWDAVRILVPTYPEDTLYAASRVLDKRESGSRPDRGIVHVETRGANQRGETVITFERTIMVRKRPDQVGEPPQQRLFGDWLD